MRPLVLAATVTALATAASAQAPGPPTHLLITNGRLIDGTGSPARRADVRIDGDTIVEVGPSLASTPGERVIDASGHVIAPGFIDMHSHADRGLTEHPEATSQIEQGITTSLVGQDGGGDLPVSVTLDDIAEAKPAINIATMVGHGTVRRLGMGADFKRPATPAAIDWGHAEMLAFASLLLDGIPVRLTGPDT